MFKCLKKPKPKVKDLPTDIKRDYPLDFMETALGITGSFEGSGYDNVAGNFDGQGVSAGILQWNYGQGSLQNKILIPLIEKYGSSSINSLFVEPIAHTAYMTPKEAVTYAKKVMLNGTKLKAVWAQSWRNFLTNPSVIEQQKKAADSIASKAWGYCLEHKMASKKSFCWFFDIVTQNGSLKGVPKPMNDSEYDKLLMECGFVNHDIWQSLKATNSLDYESRILFIWACKRAKRNRWFSDVISRKGTIAHGLGYVHQTMYDLREVLR